MQTVSCPSCGAPVNFRSHASVMAVCEFCHTSVLKDAAAVQDLGKMSAVLEDFSPLQVGTSGTFAQRVFNVVGRIQLRYSAGMWNEWYLQFDDGGTGWLGDSSGLYTLTVERELEGDLPAFDAIVPGRRYNLGAHRFSAAEKRVADCIGGQGELPFKLGEGWQARVADFRDHTDFLTLDYSDGERPVAYTGFAVTLEQLQCQLLRDEDAIKASAGRYRGKLDALSCPSCGTAIKYVPGVTSALVCPACATALDAASPKAQVLAAGERVEAVRTTLTLGAEATINGAQYSVLGAMVRADDEGTRWTEYLLYNTRNAFFWLVETPDGWWRSTVMTDWPDWTGTDVVRMEGGEFTKLYDYPARVEWAAGAFNWRVQAGDVVRVSEFERGQTRIAAEYTTEELTWSRSVPVAFDQVRAWFGSGVRAGAHAPAGTASAGPQAAVRRFLWVLAGLNVIPCLFNFRGSITWTLMGMAAIWIPATFMGKADEDAQ